VLRVAHFIKVALVRKWGEKKRRVRGREERERGEGESMWFFTRKKRKEKKRTNFVIL
jgi:hypothetical protein